MSQYDHDQAKRNAQQGGGFAPQKPDESSKQFQDRQTGHQNGQKR